MSPSAKNDFKWRRYKGQLILLIVRRYLAFTLSYRQLERTLREQGWAVDHTSVGVDPAVTLVAGFYSLVLQATAGWSKAKRERRFFAGGVSFLSTNRRSALS